MQSFRQIVCSLLIIFFTPICSWADDSSNNQLSEVTVTATRFERRIQTLPMSISVINSQHIKDSAATTLPELLQQLAGVHTRNIDGSPDSQIDLRGFGMTGNQNTLVLLDGQRMNEMEMVGIRWSTIPLSSIKRIEVLRGEGAVTYGSGATGGVINIITHAPVPNKVSSNAGFSYGSYRGTEFNGALNAAGENFGLALIASTLETDNYRVHNALNQRNLQGDLRYKFSNGSAMLKFGLDDQTLELPSNRTATQLINDRRGSSTPRDFSTREGAYVTLRGEYSNNFADFAADLSFRKNHRTALFDDYSMDYYDAKSFIITSSDTWLFNPRIKFPLKILNVDHELVLGANLEWWNYHSKRFTGSETIPGTESADTLQANILSGQQNQALYLQHTVTLPSNTIITSGGRIQSAQSKADDHSNSETYARDRQKRTLYAYDVGVRQPFGSNLSLYSRYAHSFRLATVDEIYNQYGGQRYDSIIQLLEPQTADTGELGIEYRKNTLRVRTSFYRTSLNNEISYMNINQGAGFFSANTNLPPTRRQGVEFESSWSPIEKLDIFSNYTYTDAHFREGLFGGVDVSNKIIPMVPQQKISAGGVFQLTTKTRFSVAMNYVGKQIYDNDQANSFSRRMPDYTTVDLKFAHQITNLTLSFSANNLFDEKYYSYGIRNGSGTSFSALPARGRNFWFTIKYQLN